MPTPEPVFTNAFQFIVFFFWSGMVIHIVFHYAFKVISPYFFNFFDGSERD